MAAVTVSQACRELGVSWHTLNLWMGKLNIEATRHELDLRLWMLAEEDVERIRQARDALPRAVGAPPARVPAPKVAPRPPADPLGAFPMHATVHATPQRTYAPFSERPRLPDGWVSFNAWCQIHGVNHRAVQKEIAADRMPKPERGEWWERPQGPTLSAYTSEQHTEASRFARSRWPERFTPCEACPV